MEKQVKLMLAKLDLGAEDGDEEEIKFSGKRIRFEEKTLLLSPVGQNKHRHNKSGLFEIPEGTTVLEFNDPLDEFWKSTSILLHENQSEESSNSRARANTH
jgi:hypothetical protein